jgi:regulator of protease activity HflC (stomatin/prohibitin superfamily)
VQKPSVAHIREILPMSKNVEHSDVSTIVGSSSNGNQDDAHEEALLQRMHDLKGCVGYYLDGLESILRASNTTDETASGICSAINGGGHSCASRSCVGRLVPQGNIGIIDHNGCIEAVPDGRRYVLGLRRLVQRAAWIGVFPLTMSAPLKQRNLTVVRVPRGQIGIATERGNAVALAAGMHVYNTVDFLFERLVDVNSPHIHHGTLHIIRVQRGEYAKVWVSSASGALEPKLLQEGCHVVDSNLFKFECFCNVADTHVKHGALNIIQIPKGKVAKITKDNVHQLLREGTHHLESTNFQYCGLASLSDSMISHGTLTMIRVNLGEVGVAWQDNQPIFLEEPGVYNFDSPTFNFVAHVPATEKVIELGAKKLVTVYSGEVGLSYKHGELCMLGPGRHAIEDAAHRFDSFLSTLQRSIRLVTQGDRNDLLICETRDLVKVGLRADVFFSIKDPEKTVRTIVKEEIENLVLETAVASITNIIRSTPLNEIAQSKQPSAASSEEHSVKALAAQATGDASAPLFFDKAHDEFLSKLHDDFYSRYGIDITNIRIESFKIMDEELGNSMSKQALFTAQTENQLANLKGKSEIATAEQNRAADVKRISAKAEAEQLRTQAEAQNEALLSAADARAKAEQVATETAAKAEAAATIERAKAESEAIRIRAQAEAEAIALKGEAEAKRAKLIGETALGAQLSLLGVYAEMATKSNEGVQKVVYCDPALASNGFFGLPSLQGFNRELSQLQELDARSEQSKPAPATKGK